MSDFDNPFARLGVPTDASEKDVKRAYARLLKQIDQAREAEAFARLRADYDAALASVRFRAQFEDVILDAPSEPLAQELKAEDLIDDDAHQVPAPEAEVPSDLQSQMLAQVDKALEHLVSVAVRGGEGGFQTCEAHLRAALAGDALISLVARDTFELALVHALARRRFEEASGAMLVVAADQFSWRLGQFNVLRQSGEDGRYIERLLDEEAWIGATDQQQWFQLAGVHNVDAVPGLPAKREKFRKACPQLFEFCYSEAQRDQWEREQKETAFLANFGRNYTGYVYKKEEEEKEGRPREKPSFSTIFNAYLALAGRHPIVGVLVGLIWLPIVIGIVLFVVSQLSDHQKVQQISKCDALYADMARADWRNVKAIDLNSLKLCTQEKAPALCSDREALQDLLAKGKRLFPDAFETGFWYVFGSYDVSFRSSSGLGFMVKDTASCEAVFNIVRSSNWMNFGDAKASIELVHRVAMCEGEAKSPESQNQIAWLKQLTIWPSATPEQKKSGIPLARLVGANVISQNEPLFKDEARWPRCLPDPMVP